MSALATAELIERERLVSIIRLEPGQEPLPIVEALLDGGVRVIEFSLAAPSALSALRSCVASFGGAATFGAGTVLDAEQAESAVAAGAEFLVSPSLAHPVFERAAELDILHLIGAFSPTEVATAAAIGAPLIKLFPAGRLGPGYLRDLLAPFPQLKLVPTGGVDLENATEFLEAGASALAVGGSIVGADVATAPARLIERARAFTDLIAASTGGESQ